MNFYKVVTGASLHEDNVQVEAHTTQNQGKHRRQVRAGIYKNRQKHAQINVEMGLGRLAY